MKIIIKESDRLRSSLHKNRVISEYLVYLMNEDVAIKCFNLIGNEAKKDKVNELLLAYFVIDNTYNYWNENKLDLSEIIEEINFEEFIKNK